MRYRITCTDARHHRFVLDGIFPNDWAAIDYALARGAVAALPRRL